MGNLNFQPTPEFPALQYLDSVDPGSQAERAGLRGGDFILEVGTRGMMSMLYVSFINSNRLADRPRGWGLGVGTSFWRYIVTIDMTSMLFLSISSKENNMFFRKQNSSFSLS